MLLKVLFFGPLPPPLHGQSIAFQKVLDLNFSDKVVVDINLTGKALLGKLIFSFNIFFKLIKAFLFSKRPDIVYFTCSRSISGSLRDILLLKLSGFFSIPVINHLHGANFSDFYHSAPRFYRDLLDSAYNNVNVSIVLTDSMRDQFSMFPNMTVEVVNNFFSDDIGYRNNSDFFNNIPSSEIDFLFLSNVMQTKGIMLLIEAFKKIVLLYPSVNLTVAGGFIGDYELGEKQMRLNFFNKIEECKNIKYIGVVSGLEKEKLLKSSSVFVLPSYHKSEAIPLSIIEAMSSGCAVVTTRHNFLPDLVRSDNGLLVEPNDADSLFDALKYYLDNVNVLNLHRSNNVVYANREFSSQKYLCSINKIIHDVYNSEKH